MRTTVCRIGLWAAVAAFLACSSGQKPTSTTSERAGAAAKGKHGGHAPDGTMTLASLDDGAVLLDGLGPHRRTVTTQPLAQRYFDQGLRLTYGFNHDEAARSYARAASLDPTCASCFWGVALVLGPNYNVPMLPDRAAAAWEALQQARAQAPRATAVEQALIGALEQRYGGPEPRDPVAMAPYNRAYAEAMRDVAARFPEDDDVQVLWAESMMDLNPWKLWSLDGTTPAPGTLELVGTLEKVLERSPEHPGANHYYIHAIEASTQPEKALPAADRLAGLMPGAGHVVHMPAHIYQRVGRYADASAHNRRAVAVDLDTIRKAPPIGYYPMYLGHNWGFLAFSASMEGRSQESLDAARETVKYMPPEMMDMMPGMDFLISEPLLAMVRFGRFDEILEEPRPDARYHVLTGLWLHAHGMALASKGRLAEARADHAELAKLSVTVPPATIAGNNSARDVLGVAAKVLEAAIAQQTGSADTLALWQQAVALGDTLAYSEPNDWFYPIRHYQGAALLQAKKYKDAEAVYREDLRRNPGNGWALWGLGRALEGQKKTGEAAKVNRQYQEAWKNADFQPTTTAYL